LISYSSLVLVLALAIDFEETGGKIDILQEQVRKRKNRLTRAPSPSPSSNLIVD